MTKVYLVLEYFPHEGGEVQRVLATEDLAKTYAEKLRAGNNYHRGAEYEVEEYEVETELNLND